MNLTAASAFLDALFEWTWSTSLHASVLIVLVCLTQLAGGKWLAPRWRYLLSILILVRLLAPAVPASAFSIFHLGKALLPAAPKIEFGSASPSTMPTTPNHAAPHDSVGLSKMTAIVEQKSDWLKAARVLWLFGLMASLFTVLRQHHRFARCIAAEPPVGDERILSLLESCKIIMGVRRQIRVVNAPQPGTPALFGCLKPSLLLPENALRKLEDRELRMVFLHELTHVKRGDIVLNWIVIFASSLHWFNPLVWLAMRRLCADRELVCDAMVMSHLAVDERRVYGNTLIKLLDAFSDSGFCPSLAPVINHKHEIKRRVTMIAEFKPSSRIALLLPATIVVALCCLTFTRAAELKGDSSGNGKSNRTAESKPANEKSQSTSYVQIEYFKKLLQENNDEVKKAQDYADELRKELRIPDAVATALNPETIRRLEATRIYVEWTYQGLNSLVTLLRAKSEAELQKIINVAVPDEVLASLLKAKSENEQRLANLSSKIGEANPELMALRQEGRKIDEQVTQRVHGLLAGLQVRAAAMKAQVDSLQLAVADAKTKEAELLGKFRPYFEAKRRLENMEKVRDAILLRLEQERIDAAVPKFKE
jgi:beta-lactamase regulating signal transducer with metallopeptidase domain